MGKLLAWINLHARLCEIMVLIFIAIGGWTELQAIKKQNELLRIVEWKNSLNEINKMMLDDPKKYTPIFYPGAKDEAEQVEAEQLTAAYTSLNTMEIVYHMRKDEEDPGILDELLRNYITPDNEAILHLWRKDEAYRHAFTQEFREKVSEILGF